MADRSPRKVGANRCLPISIYEYTA